MNYKNSIIDEYNIGNTFNVEDELNIAKAINTLHNDGELYKIYCNNSKYAAEHLNWDLEQSKLLDCYQQLSLYKMSTLVSIIIPCYNEEKYIANVFNQLSIKVIYLN